MITLSYTQHARKTLEFEGHSNYQIGDTQYQIGAIL